MLQKIASFQYTLIHHKQDVKIIKTQVEPQAAVEWFHCKVWTFWCHSYGPWDQSRPTRKIIANWFVLNTNMENHLHKKAKNKLQHCLIISVVCSLMVHSSQPISTREMAQLLLHFCFWQEHARPQVAQAGNFLA